MLIPSTHQDPIDIETTWSDELVTYYCNSIREFYHPIAYFGLFGPSGQQEKMAALNARRESDFYIFINHQSQLKHLEQFMDVCYNASHGVTLFCGRDITTFDFKLERPRKINFLNLDVYRLKDLGSNYVSTLKDIGSRLRRNGAEQSYLRIPTYPRGKGGKATVFPRLQKIANAFNGQTTPIAGKTKEFAKRYCSVGTPLTYLTTGRQHD